MKVYVPSTVHAWGDMIVRIWASEYLKEYSDAHIVFNPQHDITGDLCKWMEFPWVDEFKYPRGVVTHSPPGIVETLDHVDSDFVLATHHRHCWRSNLYKTKIPLIYFDAHGFTFKCITTGWYPSFHPSSRLEDMFSGLNLPDEYDVIHINGKDNRNRLPLHDFVNSDQYNQINDCEYLYSTGDHTPGAVDFSSIPPWLKILVMIRARHLWVSHTGFTSIPAIYRQRDRTTLINESYPGSLNLGPPAISYGNYSVSTDSIRALYHAIENDAVADAKGPEYFRRCRSKKNLWCQFETFELVDLLEPPDDYEIKDLYTEMENCLVPFDTEYQKEGERPFNYIDHEVEMLSTVRKCLQMFYRRK